MLALIAIDMRTRQTVAGVTGIDPPAERDRTIVSVQSLIQARDVMIYQMVYTQWLDGGKMKQALSQVDK
jgi:hypothetical protein